jgi:hypothetical protein
MTGMTWGELKAQIEGRGVADNTTIDAIDMYSPQADEVMSIDVHPFGAVIQTRDVDGVADGTARGADIYCAKCRQVTFPDPRPRLMARFREARKRRRPGAA